MTYPLSPEDRPDPADQHAVRARVPDHVARGVFSTGVIVMTAPTEFVIDFIQNLGRPHQVVARVVMPHAVMPQFVDALLKNIELYRGRYGNLPTPNLSGVTITSASGTLPNPAVPGSGASPAPQVSPPTQQLYLNHPVLQRLRLEQVAIKIPERCSPARALLDTVGDLVEVRTLRRLVTLRRHQVRRSVDNPLDRNLSQVKLAAVSCHRNKLHHKTCVAHRLKRFTMI